MKYFASKVVAFFAILTLTLNSTITYGYAKTKDVNEEMEAAILDIYYTMELIMEYYATERISTETLYEGAMEGMIGKLDEYSTYFDKKSYEYFTRMLSGYELEYGVYFNLDDDENIRVASFYDYSPGKDAGLEIGDIVSKINGMKIENISIEKAAELLFDYTTPSITLEVLRDGEAIEFFIEKEEIRVPTVYTANIEDLINIDDSMYHSDIGYIEVKMVGEETADDFNEAISELKEAGKNRLLLDLRSNPGGDLEIITKMCQAIVPEGNIYSLLSKNGERLTEKSTLKEVPFKEIVVVTDTETASAAELITAALQDSGIAKVVGETTYGKGVVQSGFSISEERGDAVKFTTMKYLTRKGNSVHKVGITPDYEVDIPFYVNEAIELEDNNSEDIKDLKEVLSYIGYSVGEDDTLYDETTRGSIIKIQEEAGFEANGELTEETLYEVNEKYLNYVVENDPVLYRAYEVLISEF